MRYAITDRALISGSRLTSAAEASSVLGAQARVLAVEGVDFLQLREKDLPAGELSAVARSLVAILRETETRLLINSRADVAVAVGADGVHLTSSAEELTPAQVHRLYAGACLPVPVVTVSCHTLGDVARLLGECVDAILFGPVFEKSVANERSGGGSGLDLLREACVVAGQVPVLALGGVTKDNTAACLQAGARGVAGIRLFLQHEHSREKCGTTPAFAP